MYMHTSLIEQKYNVLQGDGVPGLVFNPLFNKLYLNTV